MSNTSTNVLLLVYTYLHCIMLSYINYLIPSNILHDLSYCRLGRCCDDTPGINRQKSLRPRVCLEATFPLTSQKTTNFTHDQFCLSVRHEQI